MMLRPADVLDMSSPLRLATLAVISSLFFAQPSIQQTFSSCNPLQGTCPPNTALGTAVSVNFESGSSDQFSTQGNPTYDSQGAALVVAQSGNAPTLSSNWYIMFGRVEVTMKAAHGAGIVSSVVLQSDDLDEIDWEWLGAQNNEVQSNYFGKGQATSYDRAAVHAVSNTQDEFHKYTLDWTEQQIVWQIDGVTVRVLQAQDANGQYPQTPMQLKIGAWSGGDPNNNAQGTVAWAQGPTNYADGPFTMVVSSVSAVDYSTGSQYTYGDTSGSWTSIQSNGGQINGNTGGSLTDTAAPEITQTSSGAVPFSGTHADCSTCSQPGLGSWVPSTLRTAAGTAPTTYPGLPSGWTVSDSGKVVPPSSAQSTYPSDSPLSLPAVSQAALCSDSGYSVLTKYNDVGVLITTTIQIGASTVWDDRGFAVVATATDCASGPGKRRRYSQSDVPDEASTTTSGGVVLTTSDSTSIIAASTTTASSASQNSATWILFSCTMVLASAMACLLA